MPHRDRTIGSQRRICLSPGGIGGGGIGVVTLNLAEELVAQGVKVDLLIAAPDGVARKVPSEVNVVDLGRRARGAIDRAVSYLDRARPDAVISARSYINLLMLAAHRLAPGRPARRLIWSYHTHRTSEMARARFVSRLLEILALRLAGWPDASVAVSEGVAADLRQALGKRAAHTAIEVINNPAWTSSRAAQVFSNCPHPWLSDRAPRITRGSAMPQDPVLIGMGRFVQQKDFSTLLHAFAELRLSHPAVRLVLLGDGPDRSALMKLCADLGLKLDRDLAMPGHVDEPLAWLSRADLFVHSALWEGFPLSLIEALGAGLPVVATDCPSGPREILCNGRLGRIVQPGDRRGLTRAISEALEMVVDPAIQVAAAERYGAGPATARYLQLAFPSR